MDAYVILGTANYAQDLRDGESVFMKGILAMKQNPLKPTLIIFVKGTSEEDKATIRKTFRDFPKTEEMEWDPNTTLDLAEFRRKIKVASEKSKEAEKA